MILPIVQFPAEGLREVSQPITELTPMLKELAVNMQHTLDHHQAFGLSAVQVGVPVRMCVLAKRLGIPATLLINPRVMEHTLLTEYENEGCLSINNGETEFLVRRAKGIKMWAINSWGDEIAYEVKHTAARVVQHEIDHMDGKLILDFAEVAKLQ